jgi:hypothetical protein
MATKLKSVLATRQDLGGTGNDIRPGNGGDDFVVERCAVTSAV